MIARILAILLIALIVITGPASLVLFNLERQAFNAATYEQALVSKNFYEHLPALLADVLKKNISNSAPPIVQRMSVEQWRVLLTDLLPPQQLEAMTQDALNQIFAFLNGRTEVPRISLVEVKRSLGGPAGLAAVLTIIQAQPACTLEQLARVITSLGQDLCNPPPGILDLARPVIEDQLRLAALAIPDEVPLIPETASGYAQFNVRGLLVIRLIMRLSPLVPLFLLLCITLLVVRTFKSWLTWWGWPLLLAGLVGALAGFSGAPLFRMLVEHRLTTRFPIAIPADAAVAIGGVLDQVLREMLGPAAWEGLGLAVVGLAMILVSACLSARGKRGSGFPRRSRGFSKAQRVPIGLRAQIP